MKILVIGSEGNIGIPLVKYLRQCGHTVYRSDIKPLWAKDYFQTDIVSPMDLIPAVLKTKPEVIYNLAAMVSRVTCELAPHMAINRNLGGTNNIIQVAHLADAKLIAFSTSEVYGNQPGIQSEDITEMMPNNRYALSKLLSEELVSYEVRYNNLKAVILRPFMFYHEDETLGSHRSAMIRFAEELYLNHRIQIHKNAKRSWLHMDDAVVAMERAAHLDEFVIINIAHPHVRPIEDVARLFCELYGRDYKKLVEEVPLPPQMTLEKIPDTRRQEKYLEFKPKISLDQGIKRVASRFLSGEGNAGR